MASLLDRQRAAFLRDGPPDLRARRTALARLRAAVLSNRAALVEAISADFGHRAAPETDLLEIVPTLQAIDYLRHRLARFMRPERRHVAATYRLGQARVVHQPKGVIGIMAPWNYPFSLTMIPLATALAAGNRAMLKPSEHTPRTTAAIEALCGTTFAAEEVAVVSGDARIGAAFSGLAFDHLLFTGSTSVGRHVMRAASENLVPVTLELGGKSPVVVAPGAVDDRTVAAIAYGKLANGGQTCVAPDYALVHEDEIDAFAARYDAAVRRLYPAGPDSDDYTAIINDAHLARLSGLADEARRRGARVIEIGAPRQGASNTRKMTPLLVLDAPDDAGVMCDEIFGPILPIRAYRRIDDAIAYINARPRPLALYHFGPDDADRAAVLRRTTSGGVGINTTLLHVAQDDLPFGGIGPSGMGAYHGIEGFRSMSHAKGIFAQGRLDLPRLVRPPYGRLVDLTRRMLLGG
nr:coniferyl aldehyde dehydrogenase [Endobacter medicaginis]MCX5475965.1 coniferyl aldehyde dehydrogenase [Endobacter medicaginis]